MEFQKLLAFAVEHDASDIHIQADVAPMLRIAGQVRALEMDTATDEDVLAHQRREDAAAGE